MQVRRHGKTTKTRFDPNDFVDKGSYYEIILLSREGEEVARTLIDSRDYGRVKKYKWCLRGPYAHNDKIGYLHRFIVRAGTGEEVDHIKLGKKGKLDNRKHNLRYATRSQNTAHQGLRRNNRSGFKGVWWDTARQKWAASIQFEGRVIFLGRFDFRHQASEAYDIKALEIHGEFAVTNKRIAR